MNTYTTLKDELIHHCKLYHDKDSPVISDSEYDSKYQMLKEMETKQGYADIDSPTQTIGTAITHGRKVKHTEKMYSLANVFSCNELNTFFDKYPEEVFCIEPKMDGMSGTIIYKDGKLQLAATRGNGLIGENITENVLAVSNVPKEITGSVEIRGEFFIGKKDFIRINEECVRMGLEPYKTARNLVAGTMRGLDANLVRERNVQFYAYATTAWKDNDYLTRRNNIVALGFEHVPTLVIESLVGVELLCETIKSARDEKDYEIDGAVVKLNAADLQWSLGYTSKDPRWAVARKWNSEAIVTTLHAVEAQVGRTGAITPVAKIDPIVIGGVTVSSATLHNYDEIRRLGVYIGCKVRVVRSGDVIPKVEGIVFEEDGETKQFLIPSEPKHCPCCNADTVSNGVKLYCSNQYCGGQRIAQLNHFVSRVAMNIIDLSEKTINRLSVLGFLREYADLYRLTKRNILTVDGYADKSAENLLTNIKNSTKPALDKFIVAIGIPNVGVKTAQVLAKEFQSMENLLKATVFDLVALPDIGSVTAVDIVAFLQDPKNIAMINALLEYVTPTFSSSITSTLLSGYTFVITGSCLSSRDVIGELIQSHSGKISGSVSAKTTIVIQGSEPGDNKISAAIKHGIKIVDCSAMNATQILVSVLDQLNIVSDIIPF